MTQQTQHRQAAEIVEKIHAVLGKFPGYRTLHADGRLYRGTFKAYSAAQTYSRAVVYEMSAALRSGGWRRAKPT